MEIEWNKFEVHHYSTTCYETSYDGFYFRIDECDDFEISLLIVDQKDIKNNRRLDFNSVCDAKKWVNRNLKFGFLIK